LSCTGGPFSGLRTGPTVARLLAAPLLAAGLLLPLAGCASPSNSGQSAAGGSLTSAIFPNAKDAELRRKVEADHFPTAAQAGIQ